MESDNSLSEEESSSERQDFNKKNLSSLRDSASDSGRVSFDSNRLKPDTNDVELLSHEESDRDDSMSLELGDVHVVEQIFFENLKLTPFWNNILQWFIVFAAIFVLGVVCGGIVFTFELKNQIGPFTILISIGGFRADYLTNYSDFLPHLNELALEGVSAQSMTPIFPTLTYPNHWALVTGLNGESNGIVANIMYDPVLNESFSYLNVNQTNSKWYWGEPIWTTLQKLGWKSATYFWPGSEQEINGHKPSLSKAYNQSETSKERVKGLLKWFSYPEAQIASFYTLYFDIVDLEGHTYGPDSQYNRTIKDALAEVNAAIGDLTNGLSKIGFREKTNIIIVSDHGMTQLSPSRIIFLDEIPNVDLSKATFLTLGATTFMNPPAAKVREYYESLKKVAHMKTYLKEELPNEFFIKNNVRTTSIVLLADLGWSITTRKEYNDNNKKYIGGGHGYSNTEYDMRTIFIASGPAFKKNFTFPQINTTDIYNILCKVYSVKGPQNNGTQSLPPIFI